MVEIENELNVSLFLSLSLNLDLCNNAGESGLWLALGQLDPAYLSCDDISRFDSTFSAQLIARGANHNSLDSRTGNSLLHRAAEGSLEAAAVFLVHHGAQPNPKNAQGESPIHIAAKRGLHVLVEVLLQHGADPNLQTALKPKPASPVPSAAAAVPLSAAADQHSQRPSLSLSSQLSSSSHPSHSPSPLSITPSYGHSSDTMAPFDLSSSAFSPTAALGALSALSATSQALTEPQVIHTTSCD